MLGSEYKQKAMVTANPNIAGFLKDKFQKCEEQGIDLGKAINAGMGLSGESGEFNDVIKKWVFHDKVLDINHLKKELGDICWYIALACDAFGWDLDEILQMNIDKLSARYHNGGFNTNDANEREIGDV